MRTVEVTVYVVVEEDVRSEDVEEYVEFQVGGGSASADNPLFEEPPISVHIG